MGWSIDTVRGEIEGIFQNMEAKCSISRPDSVYPFVQIRYEKEIPLSVKKHIVSLFPDNVYVNFVPDSAFHAVQEDKVKAGP